MQILIADDSVAMRMMIKKTLWMLGYEEFDYLEAGDGEEALDTIRANHPEFILSDWNMPKMSGLEVLETITKENIQTTFGFITTEASDEMRDKAINAGAQFLITKPFTPELFGATLNPLLDNLENT